MEAVYSHASGSVRHANVITVTVLTLCLVGVMFIIIIRFIRIHPVANVDLCTKEDCHPRSHVANIAETLY